MDLTKKKCVPCEGGVEPMKKDEIEKYLSYLTNPWNVDNDKEISKQFQFRDFKNAIEFINKVAYIAENEGHHPDITISYNKVILKLSTHAIGGLSVNDFILARKIEEVL